MPIDYTKYPQNWLHEIRPRIMKRANDRCEKCGLKHNQLVYSVLIGKTRRWVTNASPSEMSQSSTKVVRVIITIAHLDHDPHNRDVSDDRLRAFCQKCHLDYDRAANRIKRWLNGL